MISILSFKGDTLRVRVTLESSDLPGVKVVSDVSCVPYRESLGGQTFYTLCAQPTIVLEETRLCYADIGDEVIIPNKGIFREVDYKLSNWIENQNVSTLDAVRQA